MMEIPGSEQKSDRPCVAIIGGGISGLSAAFRIVEQHPDCNVTVIEAADRPGGVIGTEQTNDFCIEQGPDGVLRTLPWATGLFKRLGIDGNLIGTNTQQKQSWIMRAGRLKPLPDGLAIMAPQKMWPTVRSPILSIAAKVRMACELFVREKPDFSDESLAEFARRRFGRGAFERLIQPLVSGIYMADPEKLSMQAALPRFVEMERQHRSLIRAARSTVRKQKRNESAKPSAGQNGGMFLTPRNGLGQIIDAITERLPAGAVKLNCPVNRIAPTKSGKWQLLLPGDEVQEYDGVILATPSNVTAKLLRSRVHSLSNEMSGIQHAGCIIVTLAFPRHEVEHPLNGHGFVVPQVENREVVACTFSSIKYAHRAPQGHVLLRVFLGGATRQHIMDLDDAELLKTVAHELNPLLGISSTPSFTRIQRWPEIMPQYHVGHLERMNRIDEMVSELPGVELAGNSYRGVGIPHCIHSGEQAAGRLLQTLAAAQSISARSA